MILFMKDRYLQCSNILYCQSEHGPVMVQGLKAHQGRVAMDKGVTVSTYAIMLIQSFFTICVTSKGLAHRAISQFKY